MRHAPARPKSPARYVIGAGLFCVLTLTATVVARWVWAHPDTAFWALIVVLVPPTLAGARWSARKEREHASNRRPNPTRR